MMNDLEQRIIECLQEVLGQETIVERGTQLTEIGLDSLRFIRLVVELEEAFGIEISDDDIYLDKFGKVSDIVKLIGSYGFSAESS